MGDGLSSAPRSQRIRAVYVNPGQVAAEVVTAQTETGSGLANPNPNPIPAGDEVFVEATDTAVGSGPGRTIEVLVLVGAWRARACGSNNLSVPTNRG